MSTRGSVCARIAKPSAPSWLLTVLLGLGLAACGLGSDRVTQHLSRADDLLEEGRGREATIELRAAAQLAPDDREISLRVAKTAARFGFFAEALEYYTDAHELDPDDDATTLELARLLILDDPERSDALTASVLAKNPKHAGALLVQAESALAAGRVPDARRLVESARAQAPDDPDVYWVMAHVYEARVRAIRIRASAGIRDRESLDLILDAYATYLEKGGEQKIPAVLGRARAIGSWPGLEAETDEAYRAAIVLATEEGAIEERLQVLGAASTYANRARNTDLERTALRAWIDLDPQSIAVWEMLSRVPGPDGTDQSEAVFEEMFATNPGNPSAHVIYANNLARTRGYAVAIDHLEKQMGTGMDDAVLLTGIVNVQHAEKRPLDAARTLERLQRDFGDRPATALLVARQQITENRPDEAVATLHASIASTETAEAQRLLARAELKQQQHEKALIAVERALELGDGSPADNLRLKAQIERAIGDNRQAAVTLRQVQRIEPLTTDDQLQLAGALYDSGGAIHGRRILESMLAGQHPSPDAALELAKRELENPNRHDRVIEHLEAVHKRNPANVEVLDALIRDDLANDRPRDAMARATRSIVRQPRDGRLYLSRARIFMAVDRPSDAALEAQRALAVSTDVADEAYELLASIYLSTPDASDAIAMLEKRDANGDATPDQIALLARLRLAGGDRVGARALYERALGEGSNLVLLKNDLAYLLAESGEDLERALQLARDAANAPGERLTAADTLGFVYLQSGRHDAAFWQFRFVTQAADPPVAEYFYHLGLALMKLDRMDEARIALARALAIQPAYPAAAQAMSQIDAAPATDAAAVKPS